MKRCFLTAWVSILLILFAWLPDFRLHANPQQVLPCLGSSVAPAASCATTTDSNTAATSGSEFIGANAGSTWRGYSFVAGSSYTVCKVVLRMAKVGSPTFTANTYIYTDNAGVPGTLIGTGSGNFSVSTLTTSEGDATFTGISAAVTSGTTYWIVTKATGAPNDFTNYVNEFVSVGSTTGQSSADGITWSAASPGVQVKFTNYK